MASEPGYPKLMVHPSHVPAKINEGDLPTEPERFPPIEVHSDAQEKQQRARGYLRYGESMSKVADFSEYPKLLRHPDHVDAIPPSSGAQMVDGRMMIYPIPGVPEKLPDVMVHNEDEEDVWVTKGYAAPVSDPIAFERATLAPGKAGDEWPKWIDGVLTQDPDAPIPETNQYPKWLHFAGGDSVLVSDRAHEDRVLQSRGASRNEPVKQAEKPYVPASDPEYDEFLAWKASKEKASDPDEDERQALIALAEEGGIEIDKRWNTAKIRQKVMGEAAD